MESTADVLNGGEKTGDNDNLIINYSAILGGINVDLTAADQVVSMDGGTNTAVQSGFESVDLSSFSGFGAVVVGSDEANTIVGTGSADNLQGGKGADSITGGAGADMITGGAGADTLKGSAGDDTFKYATAAAFLTGDAVVDLIDGGSENDVIEVAAVTDIDLNDDLRRVTTVETLKQTAVGETDIVVNNGTLLGSIRTFNYAANTDADVQVFGVTNAYDLGLYVGGGNNNVTGGAGKDTIEAGAGNDTLLGADGVDQIIGGEGTDSITGGGGADLITGNAGVDTFVIASSADAGIDENYSDFEEGAGDVFELTRATIFNGAATTSDGASVLDVDTFAAAGTTNTDSTDVIAFIGEGYADVSALLAAANGAKGIRETAPEDMDGSTVVVVYNDDDGADAGTYLALLTGAADFSQDGFTGAPTIIAKLGSTSLAEITNIVDNQFTIA